MKKSFGDILKELRLEKDLTQEQLANIFNTGKASISHYESNKRFPDVHTIEKLADYFDVTVDYLLGRTDDRKIRVYGKDQIPDKFKDLGLEYIEIAKELKLSDISVEEMKKFIELMKIAKKKEQE